MNAPSTVVQLNIEKTISVLEDLNLHVIAQGNQNSVRIQNHESCVKFYLWATRTSTGECFKLRFALHGRLQTRKGVAIDHKFVVSKIVDTVKAHLQETGCIIRDDAPMGPAMSRAIWRHVFGAGTRVAEYANGVGVFNQPPATNFNIGSDHLSVLRASEGTYTLAVATDKMVKFYLGEESPEWGVLPKDNENPDLWSPNRKRVTTQIVDACIDHFQTQVSAENAIMEVFTAEQHDELTQFVIGQLGEQLPKFSDAATPVHNRRAADRVPAIELEQPEPESRPGFFRRIRSAIGMESTPSN